MNKTVGWIIAIIVIVGAFWWLNRGPISGPSTDGPIKIGAPLILSGDFAKYGERARRSIDLAVEKFNQEHPEINVQVVYEDTHADPKQAVSAYRKLVDLDRVQAIVGPLLQVEMAALLPQIQQDNIPVFSMAPVTRDLRADTSNPLVIWPDPTLEAGQIAEYVFNQGVKTVAILGTQDSWENEVSGAFASKFTAPGGTVTAQEIVLPTASDVRLAVTKVVGTKPEAVFLGTYYKFFPFIKSLNEQGYKGKLYSIEIDTYLAEEAGALANGLRFISPDFYTPGFTAEYQNRYSEVPSLPAGQSHDAAQILLSLIAEGKTGDDLIDAMGALKEFNGVSGKIIFTDDHRATFPLSIFELQDGQIKKLEN